MSSEIASPLVEVLPAAPTTPAVPVVPQPLSKFTPLSAAIPISATTHALENVTTDFRIPATEALAWIRTNLRKSLYVASSFGEGGRPSRIFGYQRIVFVVAVESDTVITVYQRDVALTPTSERFQRIMLAELDRAARHEALVEKRVSSERSVLAKRVATWNDRILKLDVELAEARRNKTAAAKNVVAYI
jgi:hypothetical protein